MSRKLWMKIDTEQKPTILAEGGNDALSLAQKQEAVGGLIEYCTFGRNVQMPVPFEGRLVMANIIDVIANEEGRLVAEPKQNAIGTYCAFGQSVFEAPYSIVGDVLVHLRIDDDAPQATQEDIIRMVMGEQAMRTHMIHSLALEEADYDMEDDAQ